MRTKLPLSSSLLAGLAVALFATGASAQLSLKPNLQPLPPTDLQVTSNVFSGITALRFTTTTWNNGAGPLELVAGEGDAGTETQDVFQRVYLDNGGYYEELAGNFEFHASHGHFHFENFAIYVLEPIDVSVPVPGVSSKTTFCVMDTNKIDGRLPGAPRKAHYDSCGADVQGMSVGWADRYGSTLPGQSIDVTGFPAGTYRLSIVVDPLDELIELDDADNTSAVRIYLDPAQLVVQVLGQEDPAANVTVESLTPATMRSGQSIPVVITGSGFDSSLKVSFEGGSGRPPIVSNVYVESSTTIRAVVKAKAGKREVKTFDLRVGTAVLPGALTVFP